MKFISTCLFSNDLGIHEDFDLLEKYFTVFCKSYWNESSYIQQTFILMLRLKGDLVDQRNTKELWRITCNKQGRARQQHLLGY